MSRFHVGQRVRILWSNTWPELAGCTGTIYGPGDSETCPLGREIGNPSFPGDWYVFPDDWPNGHHPTEVNSFGGLSWFVPREEQLAPAYDGHEKVSWSECLWQPTPERVA